jgi:hypothetical protein
MNNENLLLQNPYHQKQLINNLRVSTLKRKRLEIILFLLFSQEFYLHIPRSSQMNNSLLGFIDQETPILMLIKGHSFPLPM